MLILLRIVHGLWLVLVYLPAMVLALAMAAMLTVVVTPLVGGTRAGRWIAVPWGRLVTLLLPARVECSGHWPLDPRQSYVVVANHQSQFDIPVLVGWLGLDLRWVMKQELMKVPFVGFGAKALGHIPIDRRSGERARAQISAALARMEQGTGLMFFPEGTRSRDGRLLPFKTGAFRIAVEQQLPIVPLAILGAREINAPGSFWLRPGTVRVVVHPPIPTRGLDTGAVEGLLQQTRSWIGQQLEQAGLEQDPPPPLASRT